MDDRDDDGTGREMERTFEELGFDPEILGPEEKQRRSVKEKIFRTARRAARQIPFMEDVIAAYFCALDPATPAKVRGTILAALAYFVLPLDAVPDFLIGIGFGDDATILMAAIALIRAHIRDEHIQAARETLKDEE
ncbi:YkvA family protein [Stappia albiluteola]|nr:YkvA family protein [Stappia albiluteola]